jgi:hypothetical protein
VGVLRVAERGRVVTTRPRTPRSPDSSVEYSSDEFVERIARRSAELVVEALREEGERDGLLDAAEVAKRLGRSREFVYRHASALGAVRLGEGEKPRLGFPPEAVEDYLAGLPSRRTPVGGNGNAEPNPPRRPRRRSGRTEGLLPVRGSRP